MLFFFALQLGAASATGHVTGTTNAAAVKKAKDTIPTLTNQTMLKDPTRVIKGPKKFRHPAFVRHLNLSVVPPRCGHIDMEPLLPPNLSDDEVSYYLQVTLDAIGDDGIEWVLPGECGKVYDGPWGPPSDSAAKFKKRNNPASVPTPWVTAGNGGRVVPVFAWECKNMCNCTLYPAPPDSGGAATSRRTEARPCYAVYPNPNPNPKPNPDPTSLTGMCEVGCGQAFNDKLANSMVQLWCDPNDPNCAPDNDGH